MNLATKIKTTRHKLGLSQEMLAEDSGLSVKTIQRIENEKTKPNGDSLKKIAKAFNMSVDELADWEILEDYNYLRSLNVSALLFIVPLIGVIVPTILWLLKKGKIKHLDTTAKALLNFQITWHIMFFLGIILMVISSKTGLLMFGAAPILLFVLLMCLFNVISILINSYRLKQHKLVKYPLRIRFL